MFSASPSIDLLGIKLGKQKRSDYDLLTLEKQALRDREEMDEGDVSDSAEIVHVRELNGPVAKTERLFVEPIRNPDEIDLYLLDLSPEEKAPVVASPAKSVEYHWFFLVILGHFAWGLYPVFVRYLTVENHVPEMSLLALGNLTCTLITLSLVLWNGSFMTFLKIRLLPLMIVVTLARVITNLWAPVLTKAVQLATLMTPFMTSLLNKIVLKSPLPPFTLPSIIFSAFGAILIFLDDLSNFKLTALTSKDHIGIGLAFGSSCFLAGYMILVKMATNDFNVKGEELLFFLTAPVVIVGFVASASAKEDWNKWAHLNVQGWIFFFVFCLVLILGGNLLQILSIRALGAPLVSSLIAFRMVVTLVFSRLFLTGESFSSPPQVLGATIVILTVTLYLGNLARLNRSASLEMK